MALKIRNNLDGHFKTAFLYSDGLEDNLIEIQGAGYRNITINTEIGWNSKIKLDFLYNNDWIEGVELIGIDCDVSPINNLKKLKHLFITSNKLKGSIDFANFPKIKYLSIWWQKKIFCNLNMTSHLEFLSISRFPYDNLDCFNNCYLLTDIRINYSKLISLKGIENCTALTRIDIYSAPKLISIEISDRVVGSINIFSIEKCKNIETYKVVEKMINLNALYIYDSAAIHSVDFLKEMKGMRYVYIGVEILDRNVSFLKDRNFEFKNYSLYN